MNYNSKNIYHIYGITFKNNRINETFGLGVFETYEEGYKEFKRLSAMPFEDFHIHDTNVSELELRYEIYGQDFVDFLCRSWIKNPKLIKEI